MKTKSWFILSIYVLLIGSGLILNTSPNNLIITIPQYFIVFFYLFKGNIDKAVFFHFLFLVASPSLYELLNEDLTLHSYNYAKLKIFRNLSFSLCVSLLILIFSYIKKPKLSIRIKKTLFYKFYKFTLTIGSIGVIFGIFGLCFFSYYIEGFIGYSSYIIVILVNTSILLYNYSDKLIEKFYTNSILLLAASPIASVFTFILGISRIKYSYDSYFVNDITYFSIILLAGLFQEKKIKILLLGLACFCIVSMMVIGGKSIFLFFITLIVCLFLSNDKQVKQIYKVRTRVFTTSVIVCIVLLSTFLTVLYSNDKYIVLQNKIYQFTSMLNVFSGDLDSIAPSPYIRITSLISIMYEHLQNPITLIFGDGYGGYFEDHFNYFYEFDLSKGAFSNEAIMDGKYFTGHDTLVTVPFLNGLYGLFLLLSVVYSYLKMVKTNFLSLACIPFLLLAFYYNTQWGIVGIMLLFAAEYRKNRAILR